MSLERRKTAHLRETNVLIRQINRKWSILAPFSEAEYLRPRSLQSCINAYRARWPRPRSSPSELSFFSVNIQSAIKDWAGLWENLLHHIKQAHNKIYKKMSISI